MRPQMPHHRPRVHLRDHRNPIPLQVFIRHLGRAPVRAHRRKLPHHQPLDHRPRRLRIRRRRPIVADMRVRQHHNLPRIARVRKYLLVPRQRRVEHHLARPLHRRAKALPAKHAPILQRQHGLHKLSCLQLLIHLFGGITLVYQAPPTPHHPAHADKAKPGRSRVAFHPLQPTGCSGDDGGDDDGDGTAR